jgi:glutamate-ammonia-ligase adenylyltransferase
MGSVPAKDHSATLARLIRCSEFAAATLKRERAWFDECQDLLNAPPDPDELVQFAEIIATSNDDVETVKRRLRRYRHRHLFHVLWREVAGTATLEETLTALSDLADYLLDAAARYGGRLLQERFGVVRGPQGEEVPIVILGMGKLGGGELNFSSDIDLVFLYPEGTESDGGRCLSAQEYFTRWSRQIVALLDEVTADGFAFRIDTRLRPFGESGPPVTSFAALESYLPQHGRDWERYAYVKARIVGTRPSPRIADDLMKNLITPFVYRRYLDYGVFEALREMQGMIAAEVERRDMADNIKLGPGGIREIEFIVQSLQLVRGGSRAELQDRSLLRVLPKLCGRNGLTEADADGLREAYTFLRRLENFVQAIRDQQTHDLPANDADRERLCMAMAYEDWDALLNDLNVHRDFVTRQFESIAFRERSVDDSLSKQLTALWDSGATAEKWRVFFDEQRCAQSHALSAAVSTFADAPGTQRISGNAHARLRDFIPQLILRILECGDPDTALRRVLAIVEHILRRSAYIALLNENPQILSRLVSFCEKSSYLARQIALYPVLLDELLDPRTYTARITRHELEEELQSRLEAARPEDSEAQMLVLGQFQRASMFRTAVADFNGSLPIMRVSDSLSDLAETVLDFALGVAWNDMVGKHGEPTYTVDGNRHRAGFGVIAYGKLGGIELSYGSDLDLVFLHDSHGDKQQTNGEKPIDNAMFFGRLVRRLVHFLTTQTGSGSLYEIDMRLRPDGKSGLLVTSTDAFERYQEENAWTWEHQALLRARPVAGSALIAREFERIRAETLTQRVRRDTLCGDVAKMRTRMRRELDKSSQEDFDLKQGAGGIGDIEFIVQYLVLQHAAEHRAVIHYPDNIRQLATLAACGCLEEDEAYRLQDVYRAYRMRLHHLRLDGKAPLVGASEFVEERQAVSDLWQRLFDSI